MNSYVMGKGRLEIDLIGRAIEIKHLVNVKDYKGSFWKGRERAFSLWVPHK